MEEKDKIYTIILRHDTSTQWAVNNPILALGEYGVEDDTHRLKRGDGTTAWNELLYETMGLDYLVSFENLKGSVNDNNDLKAALDNKINVNIFNDMNAKTVSAINIDNNDNNVLDISKTLKDVRTGANTLHKLIIKSNDSSIQSFWSLDNAGNKVIDLRATGSIGNFVPYFRYGLNQMCIYDEKLYRANKELVSEETFNPENWDLLFSKNALDIIFNPNKSNLISNNVQDAIIEISKFSQDKVSLSKERNKIYGTDNAGLTKMYDILSLNNISTVNGVRPNGDKEIIITAEDIKLNSGNDINIKTQLDKLNNDKLNIQQDISDAGKYLYINTKGNIQVSNKNIINTVSSDFNLVDNTDSTNPKILRDDTKLDISLSPTYLTDYSILNTESDITIQLGKVTVSNKLKENLYLHILKEGNINVTLVDDKLKISSKNIDDNINKKLNKDFLGNNKLIQSIIYNQGESGNSVKTTQTSISPKDMSQDIQIINTSSKDNSINITLEKLSNSTNIDISANSNNIKYDNSISNLQALNIKSAIDELKTLIDLQTLVEYNKNIKYKQNQLVFVINESNITLVARVLNDYTSDNTSITALDAFNNDINNNKLSRIGIPNEVA